MSPQRRRRLLRTVLVLLTVGVLVALVAGLLSGRGGDDPAPSSSAAPTSASAAAPSTTSSAALPTTTDADHYAAAGQTITPTATAIPTSGAGTFTVLPVPGPQSTAKGRVVRYDVEVENGIDVDRALLAKTVRDVLLDARGWQTQDTLRFVNVSPAEVAAGQKVDVRVTLATPQTVDRLCAPLRTHGSVSCYNLGRSVLNLARWETGVPQYGTDVGRYRIYQINHEVGHAIGHGHAACPAAGAKAPVMLQQTISLRGCVANTWPTVTRG